MLNVSPLSDELQSKIKIAGLSSALHGFSVIIGAPFDNTKTIKQLNPTLSYPQIYKTIFQQDGLLGFYKGFSSSVAQRGLKAMIRTPLMLYSKEVTQHMMPNSSSSTQSAAAGLLMGLADTALTNPLEVIKVKLMTQKNTHTLSKLLKKLTLKDLGSGFTFNYAKTSLAWMNFFIVRDISLFVNEQLTGQKNLSGFGLIMASSCTSISKLIITTPPDVIKSHLQQAQKNQHNVNARAVIAHIHQQFGYQKFFSGMLPRSVHGFIATLIGNIGMEYYEHLVQKNTTRKYT